VEGLVEVMLRFQMFSEFSSYTLSVEQPLPRSSGIQATLEQGDLLCDWVESQWAATGNGDAGWLGEEPLMCCVAAPEDDTDCTLEEAIRVLSQGDPAVAAGVVAGRMPTNDSRLAVNYKLTDNDRLYAAFLFERFPLAGDDNLTNSRTLQRFFELEQYRLLALTASGAAKGLTEPLEAINLEAIEALQGLTSEGKGSEQKRVQLEELIDLQSKLERLGVEARDRFGACEAYANVVETRLDRMQPRPCDGVKYFLGFVRKRLDPATRTYGSTIKMLDATTASVQRAVDVLRTLVELEVQATNETLVMLGTFLSISSLVFSILQFEAQTGVASKLLPGLHK